MEVERNGHRRQRALSFLCALVAFGWLSPTTARRTVALALSAGTDNMANEFS